MLQNGGSLGVSNLGAVRRGRSDGGLHRRSGGGVAAVQGGEDVERAEGGDDLPGSGNFPQGGIRHAGGDAVSDVLGCEIPGVLRRGKLHGCFSVLIQRHRLFQDGQGCIRRKGNVIRTERPVVQPAPFPVGRPDIRSQCPGDRNGGLPLAYGTARVIVRLNGDGNGPAQADGSGGGVHPDGEFRLLVLFHTEERGIQPEIRVRGIMQLQLGSILAQRSFRRNEQFQFKTAGGIRRDGFWRKNALIPGWGSNGQRQLFSGAVLRSGICDVRTEEDALEPGRLSGTVYGLAFQEEAGIGVGGLVCRIHEIIAGFPAVIRYSRQHIAVPFGSDAQEHVVRRSAGTAGRDCFYHGSVLVRGSLHLVFLERFILLVAKEAQAAPFHGHSRSGIRQEPEVAFRHGTAHQYHV